MLCLILSGMTVDVCCSLRVCLCAWLQPIPVDGQDLGLSLAGVQEEKLSLRASLEAVGGVKVTRNACNRCSVGCWRCV